MTPFEQLWHDRYMQNMVTLDILQKLVEVKKISQALLDEWAAERVKKYGC